MSKQIQEQFGEKVIQAFTDFARADLKSPVDLERSEFSHIADAELRSALAAAFYGVRWIYKLGLALLTKNEERAAHIRAQIVDYASIVEALLSYHVERAIDKGIAKGRQYQFKLTGQQQPITWRPGQTATILRKQSFWWLVEVSREFGVIRPKHADDLHWLREERNAVHIRQRVAVGSQAYINQSKRAYELVSEAVRQSKLWSAAHP